MHQSTFEGKLQGQELAYATSFFNKILTPHFNDFWTFEEPHSRQSIFGPPQQGSFFADLRPVPIRHTHPREDEPPLTSVPCHVLDTRL